MKKLLLLIIICTSCSSSNIAEQNKDLYRVYKISSINNYHLIYAEKQNILYKIVSEKIKGEKCNKIRAGKHYNFILKSMYEVAPVINGVKMYSYDITCHQFDEDTAICREKGIDDLYFADNIKGLCFVE